MKMAKASEADLDMAVELCNALEAIGYQWGARMPEKIERLTDDRESEEFDIESHDDCRRVIEYLIRLTQSASLMRVVWGMQVLLDPENRMVDPDADTLEHHPDVVAALSAKDRSQADPTILLTPTKRPDGEAQAGTLTDGLLAKLEGLARLYGTACYWHGMAGGGPASDHVERAWANLKAALASAAPQQAEAPALKALEFAEYMAKRAEYLIDSLDTLMAKQSFVDGAAHDDHRPLKVDQLEAARGDAIEASRAMRRDIYEFRKRAEKVSATPAPKALKDQP